MPVRPPSDRAEVSIASRVPLSMLQALGAGLVGEPVDADALAEAAGLEPAVLADPDGRVPGPQMERLWAAAVAATGDAHLGLHLGARAEAAGHAVVGLVLQSAPSLGGALDAFARYVTLFTDGLAVRLIRPAAGALGVEAVLEMVPVGSPATNYLLRSPRQPMEATVAGAVAVAHALVGRPLPLTSIDVGHEGDADAVHAAEAVLDAPVRYGRDRYRIGFEAAALGWPVARSSPGLMAAFEAQAAAAASALAARIPRPTADRALRAVAERLRGRAPTVDEVADALALGVRTLQRRLDDEGTSYSALLDEARRALALRQLEATDAAVSEVAFALGFSEPSAFSRAFRRWTGQAPTAYRRRGA